MLSSSSSYSSPASQTGPCNSHSTSSELHRPNTSSAQEELGTLRGMPNSKEEGELCIDFERTITNTCPQCTQIPNSIARLCESCKKKGLSACQTPGYNAGTRHPSKQSEVCPAPFACMPVSTEASELGFKPLWRECEYFRPEVAQ